MAFASSTPDSSLIKSLIIRGSTSSPPHGESGLASKCEDLLRAGFEDRLAPWKPRESKQFYSPVETAMITKRRPTIEGPCSLFRSLVSKDKLRGNNICEDPQPDEPKPDIPKIKEEAGDDVKLLSLSKDEVSHPLCKSEALDNHTVPATRGCEPHDSIQRGSQETDAPQDNKTLGQTASGSANFQLLPLSHRTLRRRLLAPATVLPFERSLSRLVVSGSEPPPPDDAQFDTAIDQAITASLRLFKSLHGLPRHVVLGAGDYGFVYNLFGTDRPVDQGSFYSGDPSGTGGAPGQQGFDPSMNLGNDSPIDTRRLRFQRTVQFLGEAIHRGYIDSQFLPLAAAAFAGHGYVHSYHSAHPPPIPPPRHTGGQGISVQLHEEHWPTAPPHSQASREVHNSYITTPYESLGTSARADQLGGYGLNAPPTVGATLPNASVHLSTLAEPETGVYGYDSSSGSGSSSSLPLRGSSSALPLLNFDAANPENLVPTENAYTELAGRSGSSRNVCRVCGKVYARACQLKDHMYKHDQRKRHQCSKCGVKIVYRANLKRHEKTGKCRARQGRGTRGDSHDD